MKLDSKLAQQPLRVNGDKVQLQQVILNLLVNGIDAICETSNGVREIACRSWAADGQALVSIRDSGPGIPSDRLDRLFEPFFTTKQEEWAWGSALRMRSLRPMAARSRQKAVPAALCFTSACPWPRQAGVTSVSAIVHIVDDDASFRTSTGRLLRACGYAVETYEVGRTAAETPAG